MKLTDDQNKAAAAFTKFLMDDNQKFFILSGGAGSGKSTLIKHLLDTLEDKYKMINMLKQRDQKQLNVALTATTNKAVAVLREMDNVKPSTIHSFLKLTMKPNFATGETDLIPTKGTKPIWDHLIVIDEASMIDFHNTEGKPTLYDFINEYVTDSCKVVLVGDQFQLAPVGHTSTIMETLSCDKAELSEIMRNSGTITATGKQFKEIVKTGTFTPIVPTDDSLVRVDGATFKSMIEDAFTDENYGPNTAKIIAWTNSRVIAYNHHIRSIKGYSESFVPGESVVTMKPLAGKGFYLPIDSTVRIDDIEEETILHNVPGCFVTIYGHRGFLPNNHLDTKALLKRLSALAKNKHTKDTWIPYFDVKDNWFDLRPGYATTVHKSQGSTYETAFIDMSDIGKCHIASDVARMVYVAITRASKQVVIYGDLPPKYRGV